MAGLKTGKRPLEDDAADEEDFEGGHISKKSLLDADRIVATLETSDAPKSSATPKSKSSTNVGKKAIPSVRKTPVPTKPRTSLLTKKGQEMRQLKDLISELEAMGSKLNIMKSKFVNVEIRIDILGSKVKIMKSKVDEAVNTKSGKSAEESLDLKMGIQDLEKEMEEIQAEYEQAKLDNERIIANRDKLLEKVVTVLRDVGSLFQKQPENRQKYAEDDELVDDLDGLDGLDGLLEEEDASEEGA